MRSTNLDHADRLGTCKRITWGLSRFSRSENGAVPFREREVVSLRLLALISMALAGWLTAADCFGQQARNPDLEAEFLQLCDVACQELNSPERRKPFYQDSYAVRALAVGYDVTGSAKYLEACKRWSDRMVDFQSQMTPKGAYYMNYGRKPGQDQGNWYVADSSSIALGVLATAARCDDQADRDRYVKSVESFARLVIDNYVGPGGGITDGLWPVYDGEWWCSSGIFASVAFLLYEETGSEQYRKVALGAVDWLNRLEFRKVKHISFEDAAPAVVMYVLEAYSTAWPHLEPDSDRRKAALAQFGRALEWMGRNQAGQGIDSAWDYQSQWGSKLGGLPFHMYVYASHVPESDSVRSAADRELLHLSRLLSAEEKPSLSQLVVFSMMSYAEKLNPGLLYQTSKR